MRTLYIVLIAGFAFIIGIFATGAIAMGGSMGAMMDSMDMSQMFEHCERVMESHDSRAG